MKRWTNGLPGATKRLGAMMAQRGLSASQPRMRADTHDGPEQMLHVRGLIHCCSSHVRRSWSFCLATHGPGHTSWHIASFRCAAEFGRYRGIGDMAGLVAGSTRSRMTQSRRHDRTALSFVKIMLCLKPAG